MPNLEGGFENPAYQSAENFREIMQAMARPGRIITLSGVKPPAPLSLAAATVALVLFDHDTDVYLAGSIGTPQVREWLIFHTGTSITTEPHLAKFAIGRWQDLEKLEFIKGNSEYPDRSATLVIEQDALLNEGSILRGAGIKDTARLNIPSVTWSQENRDQFPCGLDLFLCHNDRLAALPRHVFVEAE